MPTEALELKLDLNLRCADLDAATAWYSRVFAAEPIYRGIDRSLDGAATQMVCFRLGGVKVWLLPRRADAAPQHGEQRIGVAFMTRQPLAPIRRRLEAEGVTFDDALELPDFPVNDEGVRVGLDAEFMYVLDPDGHRLEFCYVYPTKKA